MSRSVSVPGDIGQKIANRRRDLGMSRQELADLARTTVQYITDVETGVVLPKLGLLVPIAKALDVNPQKFYGKIHIKSIELEPLENTEAIRKRIGENIKRRRALLGMTRDEFGSRIAMTARQIETIEKGEVSLRSEWLPLFCHALGVVDWMLLYDENAFI
jgi:transcriptional regulator with XRE-family HTH domain